MCCACTGVAECWTRATLQAMPSGRRDTARARGVPALRRELLDWWNDDAQGFAVSRACMTLERSTRSRTATDARRRLRWRAIGRFDRANSVETQSSGRTGSRYYAAHQGGAAARRGRTRGGIRDRTAADAGTGLSASSTHGIAEPGRVVLARSRSSCCRSPRGSLSPREIRDGLAFPAGCDGPDPPAGEGEARQAGGTQKNGRYGHRDVVLLRARPVHTSAIGRDIGDRDARVRTTGSIERCFQDQDPGAARNHGAQESPPEESRARCARESLAQECVIRRRAVRIVRRQAIAIFSSGGASFPTRRARG